MVQYSPSLRKMPVRAERISRFATDGCGWALWVSVSMSTRRVPSATKGESMRNMERIRLGRDKQVMLYPSEQHLENLRENAQPIRHKYRPLIGLPVNNSASNFAGAASVL